MEPWMIVALSTLGALGAAGLLSDWLLRRRSRRIDQDGETI